MDIQVPGIPTPITGPNAIVILGANGSGKTRLAVSMTTSGDAEFIGALRNIAMPDQIPNWNLQTATNELQNRTNQRRSNYWELIPDIDALFGKLWSSHAVAAMRIFNELKAGRPIGPIPDTVLSRTEDLWQSVFPGRTIAFNDFTATVSNEYLGAATYTAKHMSDGERTGLYLAARILDSAHSIVIVDEPETHFHSRLAVRFWDALESMFKEKRFVYVTHDLNFALSRKDAAIVLARPNQAPELVSPGESLPTEDVAAILGAASFSVYATRLIFCEGREEKSLDQELLRAWFYDRSTALIPVGGCENVKRCTAAFQMTSIVSGFDAVGIIDRDHWPDELLTSMSRVHVLQVHEIESLYVLESVFLAVAAHLGQEAKAKALYRDLLAAWQKQMAGSLSNKLLSERFKARSMMLLERAFEPVADFSDRSVLQKSLLTQIPKTLPVTNPDELWQEEEAVIETALNSDTADAFLRVLPGKPLLGPAAKSLGITKERYCELIKVALNSSETSFTIFKASLESALSPHLPPRKV